MNTHQPPWISAFPFLTANWDELVELTVKHPEVSSYDLVDDWQSFNQAFDERQSATDWFAKLRQYRQTRLCYFAFHDLTAPLNQHLKTMRLVADLADHLITVAYQLAGEEMIARFGVVRDSQQQPVELAVFALGKLGTQELNYSSDIDLVFLYAADGTSDGPRSLGAADYFARLGQKIIKLLDHYTQDGQVYRVDMRLRPFGSAGPLACTTAAFQQYILYEGREWERFAWMRARLVCGDSSAVAWVKDSIGPFIYRKHLDYQVFTALAKIKQEIAGHASHPADDLKHGIGGIRSVEFIVQSLQMVFGGRITVLQGTAIYPQIHNLVELGKITATEGDRLALAWLWLRKAENTAQLVADQAVHQLPENQAVRQVAAEALQQQGWASAAPVMAEYRQFIDVMFNQLFVIADTDNELAAEQQSLLAQLLKDMPTSRLPQARREQVSQLFSTTLTMTKDQAVIKKFSALVKQLLTRPSYLMMLQKEHNLHRTLLVLLAKHNYFAETMQTYPVLLEQLFELEPHQSLDEARLAVLWRQFCVAADTETWMEDIRYFKLVQQFKLMLAWSNQTINDRCICQQLTVLASFILQQVVAYSFHEVQQKQADSEMALEQLIVLAYGSAAVAQMTIHSDLDLVFVVDAKTLSEQDRVFTQKWVRRITHHLSSQMYHGKLYELDLQLRPNGNSGALITTCTEFEKYQLNEAWIWEHAAMIKSKALVASEPQARWHRQLRAAVLGQVRDPEVVDQALSTMADKLQTFRAVDSHQIEFKLMAAILKYAAQYPSLLHPASLFEIQQELISLGLFSADEGLLKGIKKDPAS